MWKSHQSSLESHIQFIVNFLRNTRMLPYIIFSLFSFFKKYFKVQKFRTSGHVRELGLYKRNAWSRGAKEYKVRYLRNTKNPQFDKTNRCKRNTKFAFVFLIKFDMRKISFLYFFDNTPPGAKLGLCRRTIFSKLSTSDHNLFQIFLRESKFFFEHQITVTVTKIQSLSGY